MKYYEMVATIASLIGLSNEILCIQVPQRAAKVWEVNVEGPKKIASFSKIEY